MKPQTSPFAAKKNALGRDVKAGDAIGEVSTFGGVAKHLHFEIEIPLPVSLLFGERCTLEVQSRRVHICSARDKAPPYASLVDAYLRERFGLEVESGNYRIDRETGLPELPVHGGHEVAAAKFANERKIRIIP